MESQFDRLLENEEKINKYNIKWIERLFGISLFLFFVLHIVNRYIEQVEFGDFSLLLYFIIFFLYMYVQNKDSKLHLEIAKRIKNLESK